MSKGRRQRQSGKRREGKRVLDGRDAGPPPELAQPPAGGQGDSPPTRSELVMERTALARPHLYGLTQAKRERMADRNYGLVDNDGTDPRTVVSATRNLLMMQHQEMDLSRREAGGNTTNIYVNGDANFTPDRLRGMSQDELVRVHRETLGLPLADSGQAPG